MTVTWLRREGRYVKKSINPLTEGRGAFAVLGDRDLNFHRELNLDPELNLHTGLNFHSELNLRSKLNLHPESNLHPSRTSILS